ncbi:tetratricopeptide repeat protein [Horticoccus sp. 23ND18S-11]|uniref:tetratricopeptide repeat protein n=1 Tax=Horticoccus sp. 23ND18S-11 TaxID=3391832 RepID=UPI0039C99DEA
MRASAIGSRPDHRLAVLASVLLVASTWSAYWSSLVVPFFFDDHAAITLNPTIRHLGQLDRVLSPPQEGGGIMGRPVVNLSLAFNHALGGTAPRGYHVFNVTLHALAALTLFGLIRRTLQQPVLRARWSEAATPLGFVVALLWTLHPIQTESVTCVIQRTELLVGLFYLLTLYGFTRSVAEPGARHWPALAVTACALGMASKEVMVSAPLLVLLYDRTFVSGTFRAAWTRHRRLHLGLAATWLVLAALLASIGGSRADAAGFGLGVTAWSYALKQCEAIVTYLALAVWPHPLVLDYGTSVITDPALVVPQGLLLIALIGATFAALRWRPVAGFCAFWFFAILAPSSSVVPLVTQTMAEHRLYLPLAAVIVLAVAVLTRAVGRRGLWAAGAIALAFGVATSARNRTLQDEVTLWRDTIAKAPDNPRAHASLGLALSERGNPRGSLPHFHRALALDPTSVATEQNIGNAYFALREFTTAATHFRRAVQLNPKFASGYNNLGATLLELGDVEGALQNYRTAIALDPTHANAHQNLGRTLLQLGRFPEAVTAYATTTRLRPDSADAHYHLGLALARAGRTDAAATSFAEALRLRPSAVSYFNYARFLADAGRTRDAIAALETALRLQPSFQEAQRELARLQSPQ